MDQHVIDALARRADEVTTHYQIAAGRQAAPSVREIADDQFGTGVTELAKWFENGL